MATLKGTAQCSKVDREEEPLTNLDERARLRLKGRREREREQHTAPWAAPHEDFGLLSRRKRNAIESRDAVARDCDLRVTPFGVLGARGFSLIPIRVQT